MSGALPLERSPEPAAAGGVSPAPVAVPGAAPAGPTILPTPALNIQSLGVTSVLDAAVVNRRVDQSDDSILLGLVAVAAAGLDAALRYARTSPSSEVMFILKISNDKFVALMAELSARRLARAGAAASPVARGSLGAAPSAATKSQSSSKLASLVLSCSLRPLLACRISISHPVFILAGVLQAGPRSPRPRLRTRVRQHAVQQQQQQQPRQVQVLSWPRAIASSSSMPVTNSRLRSAWTASPATMVSAPKSCAALTSLSRPISRSSSSTALTSWRSSTMALHSTSSSPSSARSSWSRGQCITMPSPAGSSASHDDGSRGVRNVQHLIEGGRGVQDGCGRDVQAFSG